jgi:retinol dehydrogenase 12
VLACRDTDKGAKVAEEIVAETNGKVTTIKLDLASLKSIQTAAEELKTRHSNIHLLINNAGVY